MKKLIIKLTLFILTTFIFLPGCNKETYIESIGYVMFDASSETEVGYFIFTSNGGASKCGSVSIYIDNKFIGKLTADYNGSINPKSEPIEGKIIKVVATTGTHNLVVKYENNCKQEGKASYSLQQGKTMWYTIN